MEQTQIKEKLWALIDQTKDELLALCAELIRRPSLNPPINAGPITQFISNYFDKHGIDYQIVGSGSDRPVIVAEVGQRENPNKTLCFNGHTDIVGPGDLSKWTFDPHCGTITDTQVLGRGASDMLCGVAIDMHILRLITEHKIELGGRVAMHLVPDEETGGELGTQWLIRNHYADSIDAVVLGEPTSWCNIETGSKGGLWATVRSFGTQAHGSVASFVGDNAIAKMSRFLGRFEELRLLTAEIKEDQKDVIGYSKQVAEQILKVSGVGEAIDHVTYNISTLKSGMPGKAECEYCEAGVHFRIPNGVPAKRLKQDLEKIASECGVECEITKVLDAAYTPVNEPIVQIAVKNATYLNGKEVVPVYQWASSDGLYYRHHGIPSIQYGPANIDGVHGYNETADIDEIIAVAKTHFAIIADFLGIKL